MQTIKILIICPGLRDPFTAPSVDIRTTSPDEFKEKFSRWLLHRVQSLRGQGPAGVAELNVGPAMTGILAMDDWLPDRVLLPFIFSNEMRLRIPACQAVFAEALPGLTAEQCEPVELPLANPADYGRTWRPLHDELQKRLDGFEDADVRIILGPGTPAQNLGLFLFRYRVWPDAKLFQVFNPGDVEASKTRHEADWPIPVLVPLDKVGETLPDLRFEGQDSPELLSARERIAKLEAELARARASADVSESPSLGHALSPDEELALYRDPVALARRKFALAKQVELELAAAQHRAPRQELAAQLLGISRQGFAKGLAKHSLSWP